MSFNSFRNCCSLALVISLSHDIAIETVLALFDIFYLNPLSLDIALPLHLKHFYIFLFSFEVPAQASVLMQSGF